MFDQIHTILDEVNEFESTDLKEIEAFRISYLGKKGKITSLFQSFRDVPVEHKKEFGQKLNMLKNTAAEKVNTLKQNANKGEKSQNNIDYSLTPQPTNLGSRHPISIIREQIIGIFSQIGFSVSEGPEIEDDWHNFTALNFPEEHPARDMQDTFFISEEVALRTHTSSVQVRVMEGQNLLSALFHPGEYIEMKLFQLELIAFFTRLKDFILMKVFHLLI